LAFEQDAAAYTCRDGKQDGQGCAWFHESYL